MPRRRELMSTYDVKSDKLTEYELICGDMRNKDEALLQQILERIFDKIGLQESVFTASLQKHMTDPVKVQ